MTDHARLAPSSAHEWSHCDGWLALREELDRQGKLLPQDGPEALEGDAAHFVAATALQTGIVLPVGTSTPQGVEVTWEMVEGAQMYLDHVRAHAADVVHVEQTLRHDAIHPEVWGTPDAWSLARGKVLDIWDYKFGHLYVEVFENAQLLCYLALVLEHICLDVPDDQVLHVRLHVVQPRSYQRAQAIRTWEFRASDARAELNHLRAAASTNVAMDSKTKAGPWCAQCPCRIGCTSHQRLAAAAIDYAERGIPNELTPDDLGRELRAVHAAQAALKARETALSVQVESILRSGGVVPFYSMEPGQSRLAWTADASTIITLGQMIGVDLARAAEPVTPTQAIVLLKQHAPAIDTSVISAYSHRNAAAMKLSAVDPKLAKKVFAK